MRKLIFAIGITLALLSGPTFGATWTIEDTYKGNDGPTKYSQDVTTPGGQTVAGDVVSLSWEINRFDIDGMIVDINEQGDISASVVTDYDTGARGTKYGDLFISVDSYSEDSFYSPDTVSWNYVFDTETQSIYATSNGDLKTSDDFGFNAGEYRAGEIVQFDPTNAEDQGLTFERETLDTPIEDGWGDTVLIYSGFNLSDFDIPEGQGYELAFGWAETCANDISIVGDITINPVPEPSTILLFGLGILGMSAVGRKKRTQKDTKHQ